MSASSTPTVKPVAARAAARLTVTDDLPTPPLPEAIGDAPGWWPGSSVSSARSADVPPGLGHGRGLLLGGHLGPVERRRRSTPGQRPDPGPDVALDLGPQRAAGGGERDGDDDRAVVVDRRRPWPCPRSTMSLPSSGSMTPRSSADDVVGGGQAAVAGTTGFYRAGPCNLTGMAVYRVATRCRHARLDILKALGDNTRYAIYLELARSPLPLSTAEIADDARPAPQHRAPPPRAHARGRACSTCDTDARGGVGRPQHRYSLAADAPVARPRAARRSRCWPACCCAAAAEAGLDADDAGRRRPRPGPRRRPAAGPPAPCRSRPWSSSWPAWASTPRSVDDDDGDHHRLRPLPVPRAGRGQPRARLQPAPRPGRGLRRRASAAPTVVDFHTLVDRDPCQVELAPSARRRDGRRSLVARVAPRRTTVITLTDTAAAKVKELIDAGGRTPSSRCASPCGPAGARASATRCSSTPTSPTTTSSPSTAASRSSSTRRARSCSTGATLDYKDGLQGAGFSINNPNAQRTCGCGQSFS